MVRKFLNGLVMVAAIASITSMLTSFAVLQSIKDDRARQATLQEQATEDRQNAVADCVMFTDDVPYCESLYPKAKV